MDAAGDARVGVGFITWGMATRPRLLDLVLERRPPAVMLSFGEVRPYVEKIKRAGALLICQVQTLEQAKDAVVSGADVLVAQGAEAGGHGISRGTFSFVPAVVDAAPGIPIAAAGGVADGRGLAAALMLGADGVLVGTRFYATQEAAGFAAAKERIVAATGDRTIRSILFDIARRNVWPAHTLAACCATTFPSVGVAVRLSCYDTKVRRQRISPRPVQPEISAPLL
jgi:nitronate monooxygenase